MPSRHPPQPQSKEQPQPQMKITKYQSEEEKSVLIAMIVNDRVLSHIKSHLKEVNDPFRNRWSNLIAGWCFRYHDEYQEAPGKEIKVIFRDFAAKSQDEATVELIESFLLDLYSQAPNPTDVNEDHAIDQAARHFTMVKLERLSEGLESDLLAKDTKGAEERIAAFSPVKLATSDMIDVFTDVQAWKDVLEHKHEPGVVLYGGAIGEFFGNQLCRDGFVAFMGPEKSGKSWWLLDVAWRSSIVEKRKTLLYSVGDMTARQMMRRIVTRAIKRPIQAKTIQYPKSIRVLEDGSCDVMSEPVSWNEALTKQETKDAFESIQTKTARSESLLKLRCMPADTARASDIRMDAEELANRGFVPDVIVIDYADILAPETGSGQEHRHQINKTWMAMRRLSEELHCLVVTATQSNAASYGKSLLGRSNFTDDKRKNAHITGMVGINQTEKEKSMGVYRLNWIELREDHFIPSRCVYTAGNLSVANPCILSSW